jgi:hypothetical protein
MGIVLGVDWVHPRRGDTWPQSLGSQSRTDDRPTLGREEVDGGEAEG